MCVTDPEDKCRPPDCLSPRTGTFCQAHDLAEFSQIPYSFHTTLHPSRSRRKQPVIFHLTCTRGTDLMSSVRLIHYCQLLGKGFHNGCACGHSAGFVLCVCAQRVAVLDNRQTRPLPSLVTVSICLCHLRLQKMPASGPVLGSSESPLLTEAEILS